MSMQKILILTTDYESLRAPLQSWQAEDGDIIVKDKDILASPHGMNVPHYKSVMHAIADGWRLMAPPRQLGSRYGWWLEKV